ncbi:DUF6878 family protein [Solimonas flava]|uniref:DUF6878 family protein n=1 Tax=Solimonas flava TaxID=415849 RepID=UPI000684F10A|nr:DUF6878 family protein [Solimonas flava]
MEPHSSTALQGYYARERETLATEPVIRAKLRELGITDVDADYDGIGDSGQIEQIAYRDRARPDQTIAVDDEIGRGVEALLYALLEFRHGGWENNDGAYGSFRWNLLGGTIEHEHHARYTEVETSVHDGFEIDAGKCP